MIAYSHFTAAAVGTVVAFIADKRSPRIRVDFVASHMCITDNMMNCQRELTGPYS